MHKHTTHLVTENKFSSWFPELGGQHMHKLVHGNVIFFNFKRQIRTTQTVRVEQAGDMSCTILAPFSTIYSQDIFRMILHYRSVEVEPFEVCCSCRLYSITVTIVYDELEN